MSTVLDRILTEGRQFVRRVTSTATGVAGGRPKTEKSSRRNWHSDADLRDLMLEGSIYRSWYDGGALPDVMRMLGRTGVEASRYVIQNHYNPVSSIVAFDRNAFGGRLGSDIWVADEVNEKPIDPRVSDLIRKVWLWSNLDHRADEMTGACANHGTIGVRVVYSPGPSPRVYLDFDDYRSIEKIDIDERGNVVNVFLRYQVVKTNPNGTTSTVEAREIISKDGFSLTYGGDEQLTPEEQENGLGICPYVLMRRETVLGQPFGRHAYAGSETAIHSINFALSQLDESTIAHVWPTIFATSPATKPTKFDLGRASLLFSQTREGMPQPTFDPIDPMLDFGSFIKQVQARVDFLRERQPQLILNSLGLLSGISGETLAQVLKPAEAESQRVRTIYEDGIRRAIQIAMSIGIFNRIPGFDLGTGTGTADAADRAYDNGEGPEAFAFAPRPALPMTVYQEKMHAEVDQAEAQAKLATAQQAKAIGVSQRETWRLAGYDEKKIEQMQKELSKQTLLEAEDDEDEGAA